MADDQPTTTPGGIDITDRAQRTCERCGQTDQGPRCVIDDGTPDGLEVHIDCALEIYPDIKAPPGVGVLKDLELLDHIVLGTPVDTPKAEA